MRMEDFSIREVHDAWPAEVSQPSEVVVPAPKPRKKAEVIASDPKPTDAEVVADPKPTAQSSVVAESHTAPPVEAAVDDAAALRAEVREIAKGKMDISVANKTAIKALLTAAGVDSLGKLPDAALVSFKAAIGALT